MPRSMPSSESSKASRRACHEIDLSEESWKPQNMPEIERRDLSPKALELRDRVRAARANLLRTIRTQISSLLEQQEAIRFPPERERFGR